ncbi:MAG: hypothetical protein JNM63_12975 [Spirochaetia bacterium]|nr:hypothetical protein [Spirochaetia bacterium]
MTQVQAPFLVEGILIMVCMIVGYFLSRKGKPYGKVKLVVHLFFFAWLSVGYGYMFHGTFTMDSMRFIRIPVGLMGAFLLVQLTTGIIMLASRIVKKPLVMTHLSSAILALVSVATAFVIVGIRS